MNLWDLRVNDTAFIDSVSTEQQSKFASITQELGLRKETMIKCLHKTIFNGPRVYQIGSVTCTFCKQGAKKILIHK
ncbi:MAG: FeoA family protein [Bdellovibrionales bacterium]